MAIKLLYYEAEEKEGFTACNDAYIGQHKIFWYVSHTKAAPSKPAYTQSLIRAITAHITSMEVVKDSEQTQEI